MELDSMNRVVAVGESHDFAFGGFGGDLQAIRKSFPPDKEGVVTGGFERMGKAREDSGSLVKDR